MSEDSVELCKKFCSHDSSSPLFLQESPIGEIVQIKETISTEND
jgi:hypothetical protein